MPAILERSLVVVLLAPASCWDHELYDGDVNRFDSYYLGGGNSQFRPFRTARVDPDASFEVHVVAERDAGDGLALLATITATDPSGVSGVLRIDGQTVAKLIALEAGALRADLTHNVLTRLDGGAVLEAWFTDRHGSSVALQIDRTALDEAMQPPEAP